MTQLLSLSIPLTARKHIFFNKKNRLRKLKKVHPTVDFICVIKRKVFHAAKKNQNKKMFDCFALDKNNEL
jgi:hypothetical protein